MGQKDKDYELISGIWHILRDFGDITNDLKDETRWHELVWNVAEDVRQRFPEAKGLVKEILFMLNERAVKDSERREEMAA